MIVPGQYVEICWVPALIKYYTDKGYIYTKTKDKFLVKAEDLPDNSHIKIKVICSFCGEEFETSKSQYTKSLKNKGVCCKKCRKKKFEKVCEEKYGVKNVFMLEEIKQKSKQTFLEKYGVESPMLSSEIKEKIKNTNLEKYGVEYASSSEIVKEKRKNTNLERYGCEIISKSEKIKEKIKRTNLEKYGYICSLNHPDIAQKAIKTNLERYGVPYTTQSPEIIAKMRESLYKNGSIPTSKAEQKTCDLLKGIYGEESCVPGYPYSKLNFDCLLKINDIKIDVEYDGDFWHKNRKEKDKRRDYFLIKNGFKVLRIKANNKIPTKEQIIEAIDCLVSDHSFYELKLDIKEEEIV